MSESRVVHLEKPQRYQLIKLMFKSNHYNIDFKLELLSKEKSINFSDYDSLAELGCFASLPEDEDKLRLFLKYAGLEQLEA